MNNNEQPDDYQTKADMESFVKPPIPLAYKKEVVKYMELNKNHKFKTVRHKFRHFHHESYISTWKTHVRQGIRYTLHQFSAFISFYLQIK